jgi:DNA-binding transcriptional ArsR family regulator
MTQLRAAAEPTRLRVLATLRRGEFSVIELTDILGQSQPRVSRHLKLLCDAGLLERFREQHWVYYRVPAEGAGKGFVDQVLSRIEPADPTLEADRARVETVLQQRSVPPTTAVVDGPRTRVAAVDELAAVLVEALNENLESALFYFGQSPAEVLAGVAARARRVVGMHPTRLEVQRARAVLHSRGLSHCVLQQGDLAALRQPAASFGAAIVDRMLVESAHPVEALLEVARLVTPGGQVLLVEDYDALDARAGAGQPFALLQAWVAGAGLACRRLQPLDLDGRHLVLAVATVHSVASAA